MSRTPIYGPGNPHPLSVMKTELVWEGKYDEYGNRREVDIAGCAMPLQKIETIDQPRSEAAAKGQRSLDYYEKKTKRLDDFRNRLIWGDNKLVMASLLKEFKGKIDLIYIDPPFDVGADFTMDVPIGDGKETIEKDQSTMEMVAYRDTWGRGTDSYLYMMYERLSLMKDLLSDRGSIYVHCDWRVNYFLRLVLDDVFSKDFFLNEIVWAYFAFKRKTAKKFPQKHDTILSYRKNSDSFTWNTQYKPHKPEYLKRWKQDEKGRFYRDDVNPTAGGSRIIYLDEVEGDIVDSVWDDIPPVNPVAIERTAFATQKPEGLVDRIIQASTNQGELVADFFCGSGTLGAAAERLGRRWIMADLGRFAIHTSRKRLIDLQRTLHSEGKPYRAFDVYNLGRYERQWWYKALLNGADEEHRRVVLEFFRAEVLQSTPSPLIHGRKGAAFCHVDGIDSIFTRDEVKAVAEAVAQAGGRECYCLAWEFEMDLHLTTAALEKELGVRLKLVQIPREIMEKNRKNPPPFLEVAVLEAQPVYRGQGAERTVDIKLTKFLPSLAEVPSKELAAIKDRAMKSGMDFIDFWAVDFDWQPGQPFNHHWQDYRTRKDRSLKTLSAAGHKYPQPGKYTACVKVVDTFGCDTSITVEVEV
jgi:adenine-specific DNA-methyltransferase